MKVCSTSGCPTLIRYGSKCVACRGTTVQRGYGQQHQRLRAAIQAHINAGIPVYCWRCGTVLIERRWALDHNDDRDDYRGPACTPCNQTLALEQR